jgi:glutaredoxin
MITVYSTTICPKCRALKAHLDSRHIPYQEASLIDLLENAEVMTELHMKGIAFRSAPVLQVGSAYYGPERMFAGGKLDEKKLQELIR